MTLIKANITITGGARVEQAMKRIAASAARKFEQGTVKVGKEIYRISQVFVPVDTGELKESGAFVVMGGGLNTIVEVFYNAYHAGFVHEDLGAYHKYPTRAKYLEEAVRIVQGKAAKIIATGSVAGNLTIYDNLGGVTESEI